MPERPLSLSDDQLTSLMNAAQPLPPYDRSAFLVAVATHFAGRETVGDGELHRVVADLQRQFFKAPSERETGHVPRHEDKITRSKATERAPT